MRNQIHESGEVFPLILGASPLLLQQQNTIIGLSNKTHNIYMILNIHFLVLT
jgi:hypothetical protein